MAKGFQWENDQYVREITGGTLKQHQPKLLTQINFLGAEHGYLQTLSFLWI